MAQNRMGLLRAGATGAVTGAVVGGAIGSRDPDSPIGTGVQGAFMGALGGAIAGMAGQGVRNLTTGSAKRGLRQNYKKAAREYQGRKAQGGLRGFIAKNPRGKFQSAYNELNLRGQGGAMLPAAIASAGIGAFSVLPSNRTYRRTPTSSRLDYDKARAGVERTRRRLDERRSATARVADAVGFKRFAGAIG